METIVLAFLAILFVWLLLQSRKTNRKTRSKHRDLVRRIKNRDR